MKNNFLVFWGIFIIFKEKVNSNLHFVLHFLIQKGFKIYINSYNVDELLSKFELLGMLLMINLNTNARGWLLGRFLANIVIN